MAGPNNSYPGVGFTTYGFDTHAFNKQQITWSAFGGGAVDNVQPDFIFPFQTQGIILSALAGTGVVEFSFNGITVHGELSVGTVNAQIKMDFCYATKIWFRIQSGSTGPITISSLGWKNSQ